MRILIFIGFLLSFAAFIWAAIPLSKRTNRAILENRTFWITELSVLLGLAGLFVFVFVLSGYFNARLVAAFFGASQIGLLLAAILGGLLGSATSRWGARAHSSIHSLCAVPRELSAVIAYPHRHAGVREPR